MARGHVNENEILRQLNEDTSVNFVVRKEIELVAKLSYPEESSCFQKAHIKFFP